MTNEPSPTPEQSAIYSAAQHQRESLMIRAYAGCAKTTTLVGIANVLPKQFSLALAFNVKIKKELEKRFPKHFEVKTLNGLGHIAWQNTLGRRCIVDDSKLYKICMALPKYNTPLRDIMQLTEGAMQYGLIPSNYKSYTGLIPDDDESWEVIAEYMEISSPPIDLARDALSECIRQSLSGKISYSDQIYMPTLFSGRFKKYPTILIDEAQDLSKLQHMMVNKSTNGRLIVVGDEKQSIYGWRGAATDSMQRIRSLRDDWIDLPLTTTFRCPKKIVNRVQSHAPGFNAFETNKEGSILWFDKWSWSDVPANANTAVICRNNSPLFSLAIRLLTQGISVKMLGKDIGKNLTTLAKKILPNLTIPTESAIERIELWAKRETLKAQSPEVEDTISDKKHCLLALLQNTQTAKDLITRLETIFAKENAPVTLSTGHRAKGLEFDCVIHLNPSLIPSKSAINRMKQGFAAPMEQEKNLKYVIETRTRDVLILAELGGFIDA